MFFVREAYGRRSEDTYDILSLHLKASLAGYRSGRPLGGDVPITPFGEGLNAVWLTTDSRPLGHGLPNSEGKIDLSPEVRQRIGLPDNYEAMNVNKQAFRFALHIPFSDRHLKYWASWARKRLEPAWFEALNRSGGAKYKTWWLYFGTIETDRLRAPINMETGLPVSDWPSNYIR